MRVGGEKGGENGNSGLKILAERRGGSVGGEGLLGYRWWGAKRAGVGGRRNREGEMRRESWGREGVGGIERRDNDK